MTNGYKVIDLKGTNILESTETKATVDGIYEAIEETFKPILLAGICIDGEEHAPAFIQPKASESTFVFTLYGYDMTITDDDEIYFTEET